MVLSGYIVNLVDGEAWNFEAAGSNPATQTSLYRVGFLVRSLALQAKETSSILVRDANYCSVFSSAVCKIVVYNLGSGQTDGSIPSRYTKNTKTILSTVSR